ncbi:DUF928 domain-containing protein [Coleofasciculus sp. FACHB-64]|uniref:DUF928 domain-containing protein n=2 Tax=Cyanobacteriota TaxID=1117 RepID=UPI001682E4F8|nr:MULTISPECIES: DUF928 domain-containing protein [unclassified Coleofasciculus]MBD1839201.1 DUF928 domain-containing protein [Coleofasciculus sp. FACHB-501]MBD1902395.1 DUF928 domain-containing protein [Coleofasciculus sp. FACHB-125]MBD2045722.1 DUF928 domain-containing protein [Coleofasciculus sp. FACHB-64]
MQYGIWKLRSPNGRLKIYWHYIICRFMVISRKLGTKVAGSASLILIQFLGLIEFPLNSLLSRLSIDLGFSSTAYADVVPKTPTGSGYEPGDVGAPGGTIGTGTRVRYQPPDDGMIPRGGTRGVDESPIECSESQPTSVTLLAPTTHTGLTASGHPIFYWYLSGTQSVPLAFTLVDPGVSKPIIEQTIQTPKAGINQLQMSKELPELVPGREYLWTVTLKCNPKRRSEDQIAQGWIKHVPATPALEKQLAAARSQIGKAAIYARSAYWYDTLGVILAAHATSPKDRLIRQEFLSLLEQIGLTEVKEQEQQRLVRQ